MTTYTGCSTQQPITFSTVFLSGDPWKRLEWLLAMGDVAKRKGYIFSDVRAQKSTLPATLRLRKAASNMFAGGSRASHHLRECDRRHPGLGLGLALGFYSSRIVRFSSLEFKPPSTTPRLRSRMSSSSPCLQQSRPPHGEVSDCLRSQSLSNCVRL